MYLAACVVAAHSEMVLLWSMHGGSQAVGFFFVISGFYMQLILSGPRYSDAKAFFLSRLQRIYIPYFSCVGFCLAVGCRSLLISGDALSAQVALDKIVGANFADTADIAVLLTNFTIFFQDLILFVDRDATGQLLLTKGVSTAHTEFYTYLIIPQAWSVALELQFYILSPFLVRRCPTWLLGLTIAAISIIRVMSAELSGTDYDPWTYRFAPFELAKFLTGIIACRLLWLNPWGRTFCRVFYAPLSLSSSKVAYLTIIVAVLFALRFHAGIESFSHRIAPHFGPLAGEGFSLACTAAAGLIVAACFACTASHTLDRRVGELSFPVYLVHLTVALAVSRYLLQAESHKSLAGEVTFVLSVAIALLLQYSFLDRIENHRQRQIGRPLVAGDSQAGSPDSP
jgi:peptidoglycan/LPS O-acetylase OafA/YrhL